MALASLRRAVWLLVLPASIAILCGSGCGSGPRGWQAAQVAERQPGPQRAPTRPERAPAPVLAQPHAGSGVPAPVPPAAALPAAASVAAAAAGPGWTVRVHAGWLLALAAACLAAGYSLHAWQCGSVQLPAPGSSAPGTPRPDYGAASEELRLRGRQAAAAISAAAPPGVLDGPAAAPQAASMAGAGSPSAAEPLLEAACSACGPAQSDAEDAPEMNSITALASEERAAVAAGAVLAGDPLSPGFSPDGLRRSALPGVPLAPSPALAAAPTPACCTSDNLLIQRDARQGAIASAASSPGTDMAEPSGRSEGAAGVRRRGAPGAQGALWEEAAGLVADLASRFGVAPGELAAGERVALIGVVLQTWHALQQDADAREAAWCAPPRLIWSGAAKR